MNIEKYKEAKEYIEEWTEDAIEAKKNGNYERWQFSYGRATGLRLGLVVSGFIKWDSKEEQELDKIIKRML